MWYKDATDVQPTATVGIFNDGTELRISNIRTEDIGDYTCIARNGEGQISNTARVLIAGGAVIMSPPTNQTKLEGEKVEFTCGAKAMPGNVTVRWSRDGAVVKSISSLETRVTIKKDGSMVINPVSADDTGQYLCEVSNGIGDPQSASAYLNVECEYRHVLQLETLWSSHVTQTLTSPFSIFFIFYTFPDPAKVTFTPTVQYLPFRLAGVVQCYIKANPPLQYVTWTKDKRLLEPYQQKDIVIMNNGSLLFTRVPIFNHFNDKVGKNTLIDFVSFSSTGQSKPPGQIHLYTLQRAGYARLVRSDGSVGEETADVHRGTGEHVPTKDQRIGGNALRRARSRRHAKTQDPMAQGECCTIVYNVFFVPSTHTMNEDHMDWKI